MMRPVPERVTDLSDVDLDGAPVEEPDDGLVLKDGKVRRGVTLSDPDRPVDYLIMRDESDGSLWRVVVSSGAWSFIALPDRLMTESGDTLSTEDGNILATEG